MVIQLTKTKSITIGGGTGGKKSGRRHTDVVGIDMFGGDERGFPAVRLAVKKDQVKIVASGFIPDPGQALPTSWEEAAKNPIWTLPSEFQAPHAAFAVASSDAFLSQTTLEAARTDIANGSHDGGGETGAIAKPRKFGIRRELKKPAEKQSEETKAPTAAKLDPASIETGVPVSNGGTRFVIRPLAIDDSFVMEAGMPEYQTLWLSRLLPEGKRPTVASIQPRAAAMTASILKDPEFLKAGGNGLVLFVNDDDCVIAGFKGGDLALWRRCKDAPGGKTVREALRKGLGVDDETLDSIMNDNLIDPRPVLEPVILPIADELAVSRDYLAGKLKLALGTAFVIGLDSGVGYWSAVFNDRAQIKLAECKPFAGLEGRLPEASDLSAFTGALGAALAFMAEDEA